MTYLLSGGNIYQMESEPTKRVIDSESARNWLLTHYKRNALARKLSWAIAPAFFFDVLDSPCQYCGVDAANRLVIPGHTFIYLYNGLDRMHSDLGYIQENVVACCGDCNKAKSNTEYDRWGRWIERLVLHQLNNPFCTIK